MLSAQEYDFWAALRRLTSRAERTASRPERVHAKSYTLEHVADYFLCTSCPPNCFLISATILLENFF